MAMPAHTEWTVEMVRALPDDGNRYEVIDGELFVTPAPTRMHQRAVRELVLLIEPYVREHALGETIFAPADVVVFGPRKFVQPDLFVLPFIDDAPVTWADVGRLLLAVEVVSPSTSRTDRRPKRLLYQDKGVPEYWIVDTDQRVVERWRVTDQFSEALTDSVSWQPNPWTPALTIDLPSFFDRVDGRS